MPPSQGGAELLYTCAACGATNRPLLSCGKCKSIQYCNKACQKARWDTHKKASNGLIKARDCMMALCGDNYDITNVVNVRAMTAVMKSIGDLGQASKTGSEATSPFTDNGPASFSHAPFNAIEEGTFLHNLPKTEVFKLLIDCMRLRRQDEYFFWTEKDPDARVDPEQKPLTLTFPLCIAGAEQAKVLCSWWQAPSLVDCVTFSQSNVGFSLENRQRIHDIQASWKDPLVPMQLRLLAEKIIKWKPYKDAGDGIMKGGEEKGKAAAILGLRSTSWRHDDENRAP